LGIENNEKSLFVQVDEDNKEKIASYNVFSTVKDYIDYLEKKENKRISVIKRHK
jgi:L-cysteine desulfidase